MALSGSLKDKPKPTAVSEDPAAGTFTLTDGQTVAKAGLAPEGIESLRQQIAAKDMSGDLGANLKETANNVTKDLRNVALTGPVGVANAVWPQRHNLWEMAKQDVGRQMDIGQTIGNAVAPDLVPLPPTEAQRTADRLAAEPTAQSGPAQQQPAMPPPQAAPAGGPLGAAQSAVTGATGNTGAPPITVPKSQEGQALKEMNAAGDAQRAAIKDATQTEVAKQQALQAILPEHAKTMAEKAAVEATAANAYQAKMEAGTKRLEQLSTDFANSKLDPNRFWGTATPPQKILAGISMLLGVFGSGSENKGVTAINKMIDDDLNVQQANINKLGQSVGQQKSLLGQMQESFGAGKLARDGATLAYLAKMKADTEALAGQWAAPEAKARGALAMSQLDQEIAAKKAAIYGQLHLGAVEDAKVALEGRKVGIEQQQADTQRMVAGAKQAGRPLEPGQIERITQLKNAIKTVHDLWDSRPKGATQGARDLWSGSDARAYSDKRPLAVDAIGTALKGKEMREGDRPGMENKIPINWTSDVHAERQFNSLNAELVQKLQSELQGLTEAGFDTSRITAPPVDTIASQLGPRR